MRRLERTYTKTVFDPESPTGFTHYIVTRTGAPVSDGFKLLDYDLLMEIIKEDPTEFGTNYKWTGCSLHMVDDIVCVVFDNRRIIEVTPDNRNFLIVNAQGHRPSVLTRWANCYTKVKFATRMKTSAAGVKQRELTVLKHKGPSHYNFDIHSTTTGQGRFELLPGAFVKPADLKEISVEKDNEKYRAFCKEIKKLKAVMTAKARMNTFPEPRGEEVRNFITKLRKKEKLSEWGNTGLEPVFDKHVRSWIATQDTKLVEPIAYMAMHMHYSEGQGGEDARRRIISALNASQVRYLREHCVTITESAPPAKDSDDSNRKLLKDAGLREVQVPREAEVC